jgi:hypothetical protein
MEFLRGERPFRVQRVRSVAWADGWEARLRVVEVGLDFSLGHAINFFGRALYLGGFCWSFGVVLLDGGSVFKGVEASNQLFAIKVLETNGESRGWYE